MNQMQLLIIVGGVTVLSILVGLLIYLQRQNAVRKKNKGSRTLKPKRRRNVLIPTQVYFRIYRWMDKNFILRQPIRSIYRQVSELGIFDNAESRIHAVQITFLSSVLIIAMFFFGIFVYKDLYSALLLSGFSFIGADSVMRMLYDKYYKKMLEQLSYGISEISQGFMMSGNVVESLTEANDLPLVSRQFSEIAEIISGSSIEENLQRFYASTPLKALQTLAGVSYVCDSDGDVTLPDGNSNYLTALGNLDSEVKAELQKIQLQKAMFGSLELMALLPVIVLPVMSTMLAGSLPPLLVMFNGTYGYIMRSIIISLCIIGYVYISRVNSVAALADDDRPAYVTKLLRIKRWRNLLRKIVPRHEKTLAKKIRILNNSQSRLSLEGLYMKKAIYATCLTIIAIVFVVASVYLGRDFVKNSINSYKLSDMTGYDDLQKEQVTRFDSLYFESGTMSEAEMFRLAAEVFPEQTNMFVQGQIERVKDKKERIANSKFYFYHLWIVIVLGTVGWCLPEVQLILRGKMIRIEAEDDVIQLQNLIGMLMYTNADTQTLLEWLADFSRVHRYILTDAMLEYSSDTELALLKLKNRASLLSFKRIVDKLLLTISDLSIQEAFADLKREREHILATRKSFIMEQLGKKLKVCKPVSSLPLVVYAIFYFIGPLGIVAFTEIVNALNQGG